MLMYEVRSTDDLELELELCFDRCIDIALSLVANSAVVIAGRYSRVAIEMLGP